MLVILIPHASLFNICCMLFAFIQFMWDEEY